MGSFSWALAKQLLVLIPVCGYCKERKGVYGRVKWCGDAEWSSKRDEKVAEGS